MFPYTKMQLLLFDVFFLQAYGGGLVVIFAELRILESQQSSFLGQYFSGQT